jgi:hypothetical protein
MSDSDSDGGPGLDDFMWGNLGEGDRLEVDYMPQVQQQAACSDAVRQHRGWLHRGLDYVSYPSLGHSVCANCLSLHSHVLCRSRQQLLLFLSFVPSSTSAPRSLDDLNASKICQVPLLHRMLHLLLAAVAVVVAAGCGWLSESCGQSDTAWGGTAGAPCTNCCLLSEYDTFLVAIAADVAAVALDNDAAGTPLADGTHVQRLVSTAGQVKGSTVSQS